MLSENDIIVLIYIGGTLFVTLLVGFLLTYVYLHQVKVTRFKIELKEQELKKQFELFTALNEGEQKERKRLAEELHDGIGAKLSGLKMSMEYLKSNAALNESNRNLMNKIAGGMDETIDELREISQNMKPSFLSTLGLKSALEDMVFHYNNKGSCVYQLYFESNQNFSEIYTEVIYRMVSELMHNIQKHSNAGIASIQILTYPDTIQILVEDNGNGFDQTESKKGIGLKNINNRVELYKGKINIDSDTKGTIVIIELPNLMENEKN